VIRIKEIAAMRKYYVVAIYIIFLIFSGCSDDDGNSSSSEQSSLELATDIPALYSTVSQINVNVFYEPDAEPYEGKTLNGLSYWSILEANIAALFESRSLIPDIYVPRTVREMTEIPDQDKSSWTAQDVYNLADSLITGYLSAPKACFYVFFLNGYLSEDGQNQNSVIGASITGTPVIVVFKDVVRSTGASPTLVKYVEQTTLVHEFGHAMGLVNNGVTLSSRHQDTSHGHHCSNNDCVMYWLNEGLSDLMAFVQKYMATNNPVIFGQECLNDAMNYNP
jgi:predicted Zn-dependent protease